MLNGLWVIYLDLKRKEIAQKCVFKDFWGHFDIKITLFLLKISPLYKRILFSGLLAPKKLKIWVEDFVLCQNLCHEKQ